MAKYGSPSVQIFVTTVTTTGTYNNISNYIDQISGIKLNGMTQETHAFGDSWVENTWTGVNSVDDITLSFFYDDAANTGPHALFGQTSHIGVRRVLKVDCGASDLVIAGVIISAYERQPSRGELTRASVTLKVDGAVATASG